MRTSLLYRASAWRREAAGEIELAREAMKPFDLAAFREGHLTPVSVR